MQIVSQERKSKDLAVGIVTYNPQVDHLRKTLGTIQRGQYQVIVVDNASDNIAEIEEAANLFQAKLIKNKKNTGIACALNQIMESSSSLGAEWVLTLDQDSEITADVVDELIKGTKLSMVAAICPRVFDVNSEMNALEQESKACSDTDEFVAVDRCITSGALTNISAWRNVGKYDEYLFIDLVDFDFCKRLIDAGYRILESKSAQINHQVGKTVRKSLLGYKFNVMNHNYIRKYYMTRNLIYVDYKYRGKISLHTILGVSKIAAVTILYEKDKKRKLLAIFKGIQVSAKYRKQ